MPYKRGITPLTTWHSQGGLLLISATWGLSYLVPEHYRIAFSEVYPATLYHSLLRPMWLWGAILVIFAVLAFAAERLIAHTKGEHRLAWRVGFGSHMMLAATYVALAMAALVQGISELHDYPQVTFWGGLISALSRPVLWGYIGYLHTTYARLPRPHGDH